MDYVVSRLAHGYVGNGYVGTWEKRTMGTITNPSLYGWPVLSTSLGMIDRWAWLVHCMQTHGFSHNFGIFTL